METEDGGNGGEYWRSIYKQSFENNAAKSSSK